MTLQPPGFALHTELTMYVAEELTPLEALQTATINPAAYLHGTDSLGTVAPGKLADLVITGRRSTQGHRQHDVDSRRRCQRSLL